jgi:hypothetical protein
MTLDLQLQPGLKVVARVEDVNGKPLTNATGYVLLWSGNMGMQFGDPFKADAQGRIEITALPPDRRYGIYAAAKGYGLVNQQVERDDAETNRVELAPFVLKVADHQLAGVVVDADEKPVAFAQVYLNGEGQPNSAVRTDEKGRFTFNAVCEGRIHLYSNAQAAYGDASAEAGDTNVVITLAMQSGMAREAPRRASLKGKALPDLATVNLATNSLPAGKPALLCLFDAGQRPSRHIVHLLNEQNTALRKKGITVLCVQATVTSDETFNEWKEASAVSFPVGRVMEKSEKTKWASEVESLPWLILTDAEHRVTAEDFALDELDAKLKELAK